MPQTFSIAVLPVSSEYWNSAKALRNVGPPIARTVARAAPGASLFSAAPRGVRAKRSPVSCVRMPRLASVRMNRCKRARIRAGDGRQLAGRSRTISKVVGETHVGRGTDKLRHPIGGAHLNDLHVRRER